MYSDDAWYVLLAKALATGHGYTLVNSPSAGILPIYPPGFPALLSLIFRYGPGFPANVLLLKCVSVVAMLGVEVGVLVYLIRFRGVRFSVALGIATATALCPAFTFLATSTVMSECVFTLVQIGVLLLLEAGVGSSPGGRRKGFLIAAGVIAAGAVLIRTMAIALVAGAGAYLLMRRLPRDASLFVASVLLLAGSWMLYARLHAPTSAEREEQNAYVVDSYGDQFWRKEAAFPNRGQAGVDDLLARARDNAVRVSTYDVGGLVAYPLYRAVEPLEWQDPGGWRAWVSFGLSVLIAVGYGTVLVERVTAAELVVPSTLAMTIAWPAYGFRFVLPLLPFVLLYLVRGGEALLRPVIDSRVAYACTLLVSGVLGLDLFGNAAYIAQLHGAYHGRPAWIEAFEENEALIEWLGTHVPAAAVVATSNPALVHLYTGRPTVGLRYPGRRWAAWDAGGVRYAAVTSWHPLKPLRVLASRFPVLYRSPRMGLVVLDFGAPGSRVPWIDDPAERADWDVW